MLPSCNPFDNEHQSRKPDRSYMNREFTTTDLNIESDFQHGLKLEPYLVYNGVFHYGVLSPPPIFELTRSRVDKLIKLDVENNLFTEEYIDGFSLLYSIEDVNGDSYALVAYETFSEADPFTIKVIKNWQSENEITLDEYHVWRKELVSRFAKVEDKIFYTVLNDLEEVELRSIENGNIKKINIDIDNNLQLPFSMNLLSNNKLASFTLIDDHYYEDGNYTSTLFYYHDNKWKSITKDNTYLFSALPINDKIIVDEILPNQSTKFYWFDPVEETFEHLDITTKFNTQRRAFLDGNSILAINEDFQLILFEVDDEYNIEMRLLVDDTNYGQVYDVFKLTDTSAIASVDIPGTFELKFIRIEFSEY